MKKILVLLMVLIAIGAMSSNDDDFPHPCIKGYGGSHLEFEFAVQQRMKDPESFQHIKTVFKNTSNNNYSLVMEYRAKNTFGGYAIGTATGSFNGQTCKFKIINIE